MAPPFGFAAQRRAALQGWQLVFYQVDHEDRVVAVDAGWDGSAQDSDGGERCSSAGIIGRPLMDFISGDATRMFVRAALEAVRVRGETRTLPYRCDTPTERQRFDMVISPLPDGHVRVEHRLVHREPRPPSLQRLARAGHMAAGWRCSQCLSVKPLGHSEWLPAEDLESQLLATDVCPPCLARLGSHSPPN